MSNHIAHADGRRFEILTKIVDGGGVRRAHVAVGVAHELAQWREAEHGVAHLLRETDPLWNITRAEKQGVTMSAALRSLMRRAATGCLSSRQIRRLPARRTILT